jgi:hypothetical protein
MNEAICKQPLVLFLGAGASQPLGLKTTPEFWEWLHFNSGFDFNLLSAIADCIHPSEELGGKPDIEAILDILEKINEGRQLEEKISKSSSFKYSKRPPVVETKPEVSEAKLAQIFKGPPIWLEISERIKDLVVSHYSQVDEEEPFEIHNILLGLANERLLPVFTTNYDLAIEKAYELVGGNRFNLVDGFSRGKKVIPQWSRSAYEDYEPTERDVIFFKLHGSVDWVRTPTGRIQRVESRQRDPGGMKTEIVYPSRLKREIHEEPYRTNYDYLLACLLYAKVCAVIGFSFRDQEIVDEFRQAMEINPFLELMIIDPNAAAINSHLETKLGFKPMVELIPEKLAIESAESLASKIRRHVDMRMEPPGKYDLIDEDWRGPLR